MCRSLPFEVWFFQLRRFDEHLRLLHNKPLGWRSDFAFGLRKSQTAFTPHGSFLTLVQTKRANRVPALVWSEPEAGGSISHRPKRSVPGEKSVSRSVYSRYDTYHDTGT